jgi:hypothetical protein
MIATIPPAKAIKNNNPISNNKNHSDITFFYVDIRKMTNKVSILLHNV